mgnify:CR=1 FL=1
MKPRYHFGYSPPATDSPRAIANAVQFLIGARSIEHVTADGLARQYRLKPKRAECLLVQERQRRAGR